MNTRLTRLGVLLMAGAAFAACSDSGGDSPVAPEFTQFEVASETIELVVCKVAIAEEAEGEYDFDIEIAPNGGTTTSESFPLTAGDGYTGTPRQGCDDAGATRTFNFSRGTGVTVTVTELAVGEGLATLDDVPVGLFPFQDCSANETEGQIQSSGTVSVTFDDANCTSAGPFTLLFKNVALDDPPETGFNGCTPGYWRQEHHYGNWLNRSPGDDFDTTFGVEWFDPDVILGDAVKAKGGGINALARHAVAALLNAEQGFYPLTVAEVIAAVQDVDATDSDAVEALKNQFDRDNNLGCELGRAEGDGDDVTGNGNNNGNGNGKGKGKGNG